MKLSMNCLSLLILKLGLFILLASSGPGAGRHFFISGGNLDLVEAA